MRWVLCFSLLAASTAIPLSPLSTSVSPTAWLNKVAPLLSDDAFAVMGQPTAILPTTTTPAAETTTPVRLDLPVSWQLTRSKLMGPGATTLTESFRETWTLEIASSGRVFLISPRARVPAFMDENEKSRPVGTDTLPQTLLLSEQDLARLVGIKPKTTGEDEPEVTSEPVGRPVSLNLRQVRGGIDVSLAWSEEEHFAVHLDIGGNTLF